MKVTTDREAIEMHAALWPALRSILAAADAHGWTAHIETDTYNGIRFDCGSRRVRVSFDAVGRVSYGSWQTGSYGGRQAGGRGKLDQVIAELCR